MTARALTIRQPHASLVAVGAKTIETRSWSTSYRGPLLIHAGKHVARMNEAEAAWCALPRGSYEATRSTENPTRFPPDGQVVDALPLGAVVASCQLIDCVPMVESPLTVRPEYEPHAGKPRVFVHRGTRGAELWRTNPAGGSPIDVTDQLPFGDFTPGRYAWLLGDVKPTTERCPRCWGWGVIRAHPVVVLDDDVLVEGEACPVCDQAKVCAPVPMRGRRGLWAPNADDWSARRVDRAATADVPRTRRGPPPTLAMTPPITLSLELLARRIECRECGARPGAACIGARTRTLTLVHRERKLGVLRIIDDAIAVEGGSPP